ncbi:hypothetical protein ACFS6H_00185 [Terrimonas rubra]|uniref:Uncharacterized protein n=1 Tax=Terrimonas rubra TaxID=1035890 RepID=A0ABW6A0W6_9BACT
MFVAAFGTEIIEAKDTGLVVVQLPTAIAMYDGETIGYKLKTNAQVNGSGALGSCFCLLYIEE